MSRNIEINIKQQNGDVTNYETLYPKTVSKNILYSGEDSVTVWDKLNNLTPNTTFEIGDILLTSRENIDTQIWHKCDGTFVKTNSEILKAIPGYNQGELYKTIDCNSIDGFNGTFSRIYKIFQVENIFIISYIKKETSLIDLLFTEDFIDFKYYSCNVQTFEIIGYTYYNGNYIVYANSVSFIITPEMGIIQKSISMPYPMNNVTFFEYNKELYSISTDNDSGVITIDICQQTLEGEIQASNVRRKRLKISGASAGKIFIENDKFYFQWTTTSNTIKWGYYIKDLEWFFNLSDNYYLFSSDDGGVIIEETNLNNVTFIAQNLIFTKKNNYYLAQNGALYKTWGDFANKEFVKNAPVINHNWSTKQNSSCILGFFSGSTQKLSIFDVDKRIIKDYSWKVYSEALDSQKCIIYNNELLGVVCNQDTKILNIYKIDTGIITPKYSYGNEWTPTDSLAYYIKINT